MNEEEYLSRIGIEEFNFEVSVDNLKLLQKQHLLYVPFENLDIHRRVPITLDTDNFYRKIIQEKRGGFCYELNGLFFCLLKNLGFAGKIISARVADGPGHFGKEYDHLAILTEIGGAEYLVDVGFGDFTAEPLKFVLDAEQTDQNGIFLLSKFDEDYFEVSKKNVDEWQSEYIFKDLNRDLTEFTEMCEFHQTSPDSHFTRGRVCSLMTENGRKTLTDKKFIETVNGGKKEIEISSDDEFEGFLKKEFGIKI